jgi:plasmid stabilization system protein ParE
MKVIYTEEALENLDGILAYISSNYPTVFEAFQSRLRSMVNRMSDWPDSAQEVAECAGRAADPISLQDILSEHGPSGRDTLHSSRHARRVRP